MAKKPGNQWTEPPEAKDCSTCNFWTDTYPGRCLCSEHYNQYLRRNLTRFQYWIWILNTKLGIKAIMRNYDKYGL